MSENKVNKVSFDALAAYVRETRRMIEWLAAMLKESCDHDLTREILEEHLAEHAVAVRDLVCPPPPQRAGLGIGVEVEVRNSGALAGCRGVIRDYMIMPETVVWRVGLDDGRTEFVPETELRIAIDPCALGHTPEHTGSGEVVCAKCGGACGFLAQTPPNKGDIARTAGRITAQIRGRV